ncbi:putative Streptopain [Candidatus Zixiibacteriota bacterium]|nr:putative Streptopain [candidate division Zixibacteria bacterium]
MLKSLTAKSVCAMLIFFLLIASASSLFATTATLNDMSQVCNNWLTTMVLRNGSWAGSTAPTIASVKDIRVSDTVVARYFEISPNGYIIVPVLKELPVVQAYSEENRINWDDPDGVPVMLKDVLADRARRFVMFYGSLDAAQPDTGVALLAREQRQQWYVYQKDENEFKSQMTAMKMTPTADLGPLVTTVWHQNDPYNMYCPQGDGGRCVVGCVATAAAQVMAYHKWPLQGSGVRTYYWSGDNSCGGHTPGMMITGDFNHAYDWDNIRNTCGYDCTTAQKDAMARLCSDVGIAYSMMYGHCGSGAYLDNTPYVFSHYFRYNNNILELERSGTSLKNWSDSIKAEIENNRPIVYGIYSHAIVCDGWRQVDAIYQVHMNYGWGGSNNFWYTIDQLYCPWSGCSPWVESMYTHIEPDRGVYFTSDTTWGTLPLQVDFAAVTSFPTVDTWTWSFGDGDSAFVESPTHVYTTPGRYDVKVQIQSGSDIRSYTVTKYITALADTLKGGRLNSDPGRTVALTISARNTVPVSHIQIPICFKGDMALTLDSFSTAGCRTDYFEHVSQTMLDEQNCLTSFSLYNSSVGAVDLAAGDGPVLKLYFTIPAGATSDLFNNIGLEGFGTYAPMFYGPVVQFSPKHTDGLIGIIYKCGDANNDETINILDVSALINYLYHQGFPPLPLGRGDANGNGTVNILDVSTLISFLYRGGTAPICPVP